MIAIPCLLEETSQEFNASPHILYLGTREERPSVERVVPAAIPYGQFSFLFQPEYLDRKGYILEELRADSDITCIERS